jgi:hypothetical protein
MKTFDSVSFLIRLCLTVSALVAAQANAAIISYSGSTSDSLSYTASGTGVTLIPFVGYEVPSQARDVSYSTLSLNKFDPALGTLNSIRINLSGTGTTTHSRLGACETLIFAILCGFTIDTSSLTTFGWDVPVIGDNGPLGPPIVDGVPSAPYSDIFARQTFLSFSQFAFLGFDLEDNAPNTSGPLSATYLLAPNEAYIGTGTFSIAGEILGDTTATIKCNIAVLAVCQGGTNTINGFSWNAAITYDYTVAAPPPPPSSVPLPGSALLFLTGLTFIGSSRRRWAGRVPS